MSWWDLQHFWRKGGISSFQMATVKMLMLKQLVVATTAVQQWVFKLFDYITW